MRNGSGQMRALLGIVILFAAAWLMYRLQAGKGSCCPDGHEKPGADQDPDLV